MSRRPKISQREARRLQLQVGELERAADAQRTFGDTLALKLARTEAELARWTKAAAEPIELFGLTFEPLWLNVPVPSFGKPGEAEMVSRVEPTPFLGKEFQGQLLMAARLGCQIRIEATEKRDHSSMFSSSPSPKDYTFRVVAVRP